MKKRKAVQRPESRINENLRQSDSRIRSTEEAESKLRRSKSLVELTDALYRILEFSRGSIPDHRERYAITKLCYAKAEELLEKEIRDIPERDSLPKIVSILGTLSLSTPDAPLDDKKVFEKCERYIGRFTHILDQKNILRVALGFANRRSEFSPKIFDKLSDRFIALAQSHDIASDSLTNILLFCAAAKYQPSDEFFNAWDEVAEHLKANISDGHTNSLPTADAAEAVYHLALFKAEGMDVPQELVEKWFDYAANTKDATFDHKSWRQMYLAALAFDFPEPERFKIRGTSQTKSNSYAQASYRKKLEKNAAQFTRNNQSGISIAVEEEQLSDIIDSTVDYKVTISGGAGASNQETIFWVQYDGHNHFRQKSEGREYDSQTKLQNMIMESRLAENERLIRVDYKEVEKMGQRHKNMKDGVYFHAKDLCKHMVKMHRERSLGLGENAKSTNGLLGL